MEKKQITIPGMVVPPEVAKYICGYLYGLSINKAMNVVFRMYAENKYKAIYAALDNKDKADIDATIAQLNLEIKKQTANG